jgi:hypothetical protein
MRDLLAKRKLRLDEIESVEVTDEYSRRFGERPLDAFRLRSCDRCPCCPQSRLAVIDGGRFARDWV